MQHRQIENIIMNLGGRRAYEEKRAAKLGFSNLYDYFQEKLAKKARILENAQNRIAQFKANKALLKRSKKQEKKSCSCC